MKHKSLFLRLSKTAFAALGGFLLYLSGTGIAQAQRSPFYGGYGYGGYGGYGYYGGYYPGRNRPSTAPVAPPVSPVVPAVPVPIVTPVNYYRFEYYGLGPMPYLTLDLETRAGMPGQGSAIVTSLSGAPPNPWYGDAEYSSIKLVDGLGQGSGKCYAFTSGSKPTYAYANGCLVYPGNYVLVTHQEPERLRAYNTVTGVALPVARTARYVVTGYGELVLYSASPAYKPSKKPGFQQYRLPDGSWTGGPYWPAGTEW
ncbi:MAG: hypothetical protein LBP58_03670 [Azoarcus sp.]|nr:hypothetical protein [Azoarcus sp.]